MEADWSIMSTVSDDGKLAYLYDLEDDTWYPVTGSTNTTANYIWSGTDKFLNSATYETVVRAKGGVNNFLNPSSRNDVIANPINGLVCFIQQTDNGDIINQIQYYYNGSWREYSDSVYLASVSASKTLSLSDVGKTLKITSNQDVIITIPTNAAVPILIGQRVDLIRYGVGGVFISEASGVTVLSKNSNKKIAARYSGGSLVKTDTDTWILIGDLTA